MKIALLVTQLESGGAQKAALTLARGLKERGHIAVLFVMYEKEPCLERFEQEYGVSIISLGMKDARNDRLRNGWLALQGSRRFIKELKNEKYDVLQTFTHFSNILGPVYAKMAGVKRCVASQRNAMSNKPKWVQLTERFILNSSMVGKVTAVSKKTMEYSIDTQGIQKGKLCCIPNSVNAERYAEPDGNDRFVAEELSALAGGDFWMLCVGRLHAQKGHVYLLHAFKKVLKIHLGARLFLVGEGNLKDEILALIESLHLQDSVYLLGVRKDIPQLLRACQLFVLPSLYEGMPNVVLEAMAAKTPVVATSVDGSCELIDDEVTGFLVHPACADALEAGLLKMITTPDRSRLIDHAYQQVLSEHSVLNNITSYERIYINL